MTLLARWWWRWRQGRPRCRLYRRSCTVCCLENSFEVKTFLVLHIIPIWWYDAPCIISEWFGQPVNTQNIHNDPLYGETIQTKLSSSQAILISFSWYNPKDTTDTHPGKDTGIIYIAGDFATVFDFDPFSFNHCN